VDEKGYVRAVVGGWQDRIEELRALVDQYASLLEPMTDQAALPNCLVVTFTSRDGRDVRRYLYLNENLAAARAILEDPNADHSELLRWAELLLSLEEGTVLSVELGQHPRMAIGAPTVGLLAKTFGVMQSLGTSFHGSEPRAPLEPSTTGSTHSASRRCSSSHCGAASAPEMPPYSP
jgi:hypothetical protein